MDLQKVRGVQNKHAKIITAKLLGSLEANPLMIGTVELALIAYDKERALAELEKPDDVLSTLIDNAIRRAEIEYLNENHPEALKVIRGC